MPRRRRKNPLLGRIVLISVAAHVVALPILAHFGAFKKLERRFGPADLTMIAPNLPDAPKAAPPKVARKAKSPGQKRLGGGAHLPPAAPRADEPAVVAGTGDGSGGGPVVDQGTGKAGALPPASAAPPPAAAPVKPAAPARRPPAPEAKPVERPAEKPAASAPPPPAPAKHVPVYTEVDPVYQPQPEVPDDLRDAPLDATCTLELDVAADGTVSAARVAGSCGNAELDAVALKTAKTWRFRPATADGAPVEGRLKLHIEFKVS